MRIWQCATFGFLAVILLTPPDSQAQETTPLWSGTGRLADVETLTESMRRHGATELPLEALAYYDLGIQAFHKGNKEQAIVHLENSIALDGSFPEAHFALARVTFPGVPFWGAVRDGIKASFNSFDSQHILLVNVIAGLIATLVLGASLVLIFSGAQLLPRVQHVLSELLARWFSKSVAATAALLLLAAPFIWGVGLLPAWLLLGGIMWPWMRHAQRQWIFGLVAATVVVPLFLWGLSPLLFYPLDPQGKPFLLSRAMSSPDNPSLLKSLDEASVKDPEDANLHFAHGLLDKRAGRFDASQKHFLRSLELGGPNAAIRNNLGVLAFLEEDYDRSISHFRQAVDADKTMAAPHFNLSQAFAKKLYFDMADEELKEANRLAFNRIRGIIKRQRGGRNSTLLDERLPASALWWEAWHGTRMMAQIPPGLRLLFPGSLTLLPALCLPLFGIGLVVGRRMYRYLAGLECTNCRRPVCRRCLRRIQRRPYCKTCGETLLQVQSVAYSKLVLDSRLKRTGRAGAVVHKAFNWLLPGYHALRIGKTHTGAVLCVGFVFALLGLLSGHLPLQRVAWISQQPGPWWPALPLAALAVVQGLSWLTLWRLNETTNTLRPQEGDADEDEPVLFTGQAA